MSRTPSKEIKVVVKAPKIKPPSAKKTMAIQPAQTKTTENTLPLETVMDAYKLMLKIRRFEEKAANLYQQGKIGGFCHLYIGQEAVLTGCKAATKPEDDYITSYRCHAHALACDITPEAVMSELTGRGAGISKGKGGSMHMFEPSKHFWGGHGIVGAQVPLGAGLAFASKYKKTNTVSLTFIGDGAMNEGAVYEAFNMAKLWKLPAIFIVENNMYGMGTSVDRASAGELYKRGESFDIPGERVDGMDFFAVQDAVAKAAEKARKGEPQLLEMMTYRYRGHSMSDPAKYRTRDEVEEWKDTKDPINALRKTLMEQYGQKEDDLKKLDADTKAAIAKAAEFATTTPEPEEKELWTDIVPENKLSNKR